MKRKMKGGTNRRINRSKRKKENAPSSGSAKHSNHSMRNINALILKGSDDNRYYVMLLLKTSNKSIFQLDII